MRHLRHLVALAETRHFGKAAEKCLVTQSSLSASIAELERILGAPVAERTRRTVRLTPLGLQLAARAREILLMAEDMVDMARRQAGSLPSPLRMGVIPTIGPWLLPRAVTALHERHPDVELLLREERTAPLLEHLRDGNLDCAIIALPWPDLKGLSTEVLFHDPFLLAMPEDHPLAAGKDCSLDTLDDDTPLLLLEEGHCLREHALAACRLKGRKKGAAYEATSLFTLAQMTAAGAGVTLLPRLAVQGGITTGLKLATRPMHDAPGRDIALAWRAASPLSDAFLRLAPLLRDHAPARGPDTPA